MLTYLHKVKTTPVRRWTPAAISCYERGCRCSGCFYRDSFLKHHSRNICQMKQTVIELVRTLGTPNNPLSQAEILEIRQNTPSKKEAKKLLPVAQYLHKEKFTKIRLYEIPSSIAGSYAAGKAFKELMEKNILKREFEGLRSHYVVDNKALTEYLKGYNLIGNYDA